MGILQDLVAKLQGFQETTSSEPEGEKVQDGSDIFPEITQSSSVETNKEQVGEKFTVTFIPQICF